MIVGKIIFGGSDYLWIFSSSLARSKEISNLNLSSKESSNIMGDLNDLTSSQEKLTNSKGNLLG